MSDKSFVSSRFPRRDFLKIGSLGLAGLAGTAYPSMAFGALQHLPTSLLSAGYADAEPAEGTVTWLTPAQRLLSGDAGFIGRDAQVTIRSSARAASASDTFEGAMIDVVFPALGYQPDAYPTYHAWSARRDEYGDQASGPVSFRVPVEPTTGLQLVFTRMRPDTDPSVPQPPDDMLQLGLGFSNAPKLQRGIYVIAYGQPTVSNWSVVPITRQGRDIVVPHSRFSYVVLEIAYAG